MDQVSRFDRYARMAQYIQDPEDHRYIEIHAYLADCYFYGEHVEVDLSRALDHYQRALLGGLRRNRPSSGTAAHLSNPSTKDDSTDEFLAAKIQLTKSQIERCKRSLYRACQA